MDLIYYYNTPGLQLKMNRLFASLQLSPTEEEENSLTISNNSDNEGTKINPTQLESHIPSFGGMVGRV